MTAFFLANASSVTPPPRPVTASTGASSSTASTAEDVVVLPMPISPTPSTSASVSAASSMPVSTARSHSSRVMALPRAIFFVPKAILRHSTAFSRMFAATPTSQTVIAQPKCLQSVAAPVLPRVRLIVCESVTERGALETPSSTTPLSAAKTRRCFFSILLCTRPVIPASCTERSSSLPRLPGGLASCA